MNKWIKASTGHNVYVCGVSVRICISAHFAIECNAHLCYYFVLLWDEMCCAAPSSENVELPWIPVLDHCSDIAVTCTMAMYSAGKSFERINLSIPNRQIYAILHEEYLSNKKKSYRTYLTGIMNTSAWLSPMNTTLIRLHAIWWCNCGCIHGKRLGRLLVGWRWLALNCHNGVVSVSGGNLEEHLEMWWNIVDVLAITYPCMNSFCNVNSSANEPASWSNVAFWALDWILTGVSKSGPRAP